MDASPFLPSAAAELDADHAARRTLNRHKAFATALLVLMAALTLASYALPAGLRDRGAAGGGEGRLRRRHRRLVRGHGAVPPSAWPADPAHRHHPRAEGAARPRARPLRRQPRVHRRGGAAPDRPHRPCRHRRALPRRSGGHAPGGRGAGGDAAAAAGERGGRPGAPPAGPHRAARARRAGRRARGRRRAAQAGRGRAAPGSVRLHPRHG